MSEQSKKNTVKMRSISRKIAIQWNFRSMLHFLMIDLICIISKIILWMSITEATYCKKNLFNIELFNITGKFICEDKENFESIIQSFYYVIPEIDEKIFAGNMLIETISITSILIITELIFLICGFLKGSKIVRKKLAPLNRLAITAQMISKADFDDDRFRELESALESIDANNTDCHVSTGNTELQGIENAINHLIERMRNSYLQQARFVSDASHELRTPISVIKGYANMLNRWGKNDEKILEESISAIKSESESMERLVEQLLFLARGDNGKTQLNCEDINLYDIMKELHDEYSMVDSNHIYKFDKNRIEVMAYGDYAMLKQVARVLADNAAKYTPEGNEIIFSAYVSDDGTPAFEIQDTGIGISEDDIPKVFERFYRADDARNRKTGGTGLGLSIAKWIVDRHRGYFKLVSFVDAGTKFTVFLPEKRNQTENKKEAV